MPVPPAFAASALYDSLLQGALQRFLARATLELEASLTDSDIRSLAIEPTDDPCELVLRWFGTRHILHVPRSQPFTAHELRVARAIGEVLAARYSTIFDSAVMAARADLFQGLIEDRYVAAFLDRRPYRAGVERNRADRLAHCIEVLRVAALSSYESHAISSGVLVLGDDEPHARQGAARMYGQSLTAIKSFYRLCDGMRTVFLVGEDGLLLDIIDITHRAREIHPMMAITSPCPSAYRQHAASTLGTRDTCIVLSPSHEIKSSPRAPTSSRSATPSGACSTSRPSTCSGCRPSARARSRRSCSSARSTWLTPVRAPCWSCCVTPSRQEPWSRPSIASIVPRPPVRRARAVGVPCTTCCADARSTMSTRAC
jgi:hypothetical protein